MELLLFVVLLVLILSIRSRVVKLERVVASGSFQATPLQSGAESKQPILPESLMTYIQQQLQSGAAHNDIKKVLVAGGWNEQLVEQALLSTGMPVAQNSRGTQTAPIAGRPSGSSSQAVPFGVRVPSEVSVSSVDRFISWMKEDWMLKLGALFLIMGFGWLTTYAFMNDWVGPVGRIMFGIFVGVCFQGLGWWRIRTYIHQGGVFMVLGSTIMLLTIFAAREMYNFFTPLTALALMFLSTVFVALASVTYKSRALALSSLILAGIAPLFTQISSLSVFWLFSYLLVVVVGALLVALLTGRRELTTAALVIVTLYSLPHIGNESLLLFAFAFSAIFFITNTAGIVRLGGTGIAADALTAGGNGFFLLVWIMSAAPKEWQSLLIVAWMIVFSVGAFMIFRITQRREPFYVYAGVGVMLLAAATSAEVSGATLIIAYTIESAIIAMTSYVLMRDIKIGISLSYLLVLPILMSMSSIFARQWETSVFHEHFFVLLLLAATLLGLGSFFAERVRTGGVVYQGQGIAVLVVLGSAYAYVLLWLSLHAALASDSTAVMLSLLAYTLVGLTTYFYGHARNLYQWSTYGGALIGFVVVRLIVIDVWQMELSGRIITFFMIGALLVSTAFLRRKKKLATQALQR